jgi:type I restriction enzyme S subunit
VSDWRSVPLGFCVAEVRRKNLGGREQNLLSLSYGNIVRKDIASTEGLLPESFDTYNCVEAGDTVLRLTDLQNDQRSLRVGLVQEAGIITSAYISLRPCDTMEPKFLNYYLKNMDFRKDFYALGAGVRQSLKFDELRRISVPVPPIQTQRAIADYLDTETARIDALIAKKQRMMELLDERFRSNLTAMVVDSDAPRGGPTSEWYGPLPAGWRIARVRHVTTAILDGPHVSPTYVDEGGIPFLSVRNVGFHDWDLSTAKHISIEDFETFNRRIEPRPGDVLLTKGGNTGIARAVDLNFRFQVWVHIAILRPNALVLPRYLAACLNSRPGYEQSQLWTRGATNQDLVLSRIAEIEIVLPPLEAQARQVERLERDTRLDRRLRDGLERQIELLREHRQALITAAVTGELEIPGVAA